MAHTVGRSVSPFFCPSGIFSRLTLFCGCCPLSAFRHTHNLAHYPKFAWTNADVCCHPCSPMSSDSSLHTLRRRARTRTRLLHYLAGQRTREDLGSQVRLTCWVIFGASSADLCHPDQAGPKEPPKDSPNAIPKNGFACIPGHACMCDVKTESSVRTTRALVGGRLVAAVQRHCSSFCHVHMSSSGTMTKAVPGKITDAGPSACGARP